MEATLQSVSQDMPHGYSMLVIGSNGLSTVQIVRNFHNISRNVSIFRTIPAAMRHLRNRPVQVLILIPDDCRTWTTAARHIDQVLTHVFEKPHKFCLLQGPYQGPSDRLAGSRLGWRVLYG